jgi:SAM-dependent methyltransferase
MKKSKKFTFITNQDNPHLGGNILERDPASFCLQAWKYVIDKYSIKSVMDVGSGVGHAGLWFKEQGLEITAIDGLADNVKNSHIPAIEHDLTSAPFVKQVDLVNCVEVVEHIEEKYIGNLLDTMCSGTYIFMTHAVPGQKGWHHVNCQPTEYWVKHLSNRNYTVLHDDSAVIKKLAQDDSATHITRTGMLFKRNS